MRKIMTCMLIAALFLSACGTAESGALTGMIIELTENGFAFHTEEGIRFVTVSEDTMPETECEPAVGDVVTVVYSGATDRRTLNADTVICCTLTGKVTEIVEQDEPYFLLTPDDGSGIVRVNCTRSELCRVAAGISVTVYYSGAQTRSVPPQITSQYIRGLVLTGRITDIDEDGTVRLELENGETVILHCPEEALILTELDIGKSISASVSPQVRLSIPAQYEALDIISTD